MDLHTIYGPVRDAFACAAAVPGVVDLEVRRVPIEAVVADLYSKWRDTPPVAFSDIPLTPQRPSGGFPP